MERVCGGAMEGCVEQLWEGCVEQGVCSSFWKGVWSSCEMVCAAAVE